MSLRFSYILLVFLCVYLQPQGAWAQPIRPVGIAFGIRYEDGRYIVSMRPTVTPEEPNQSLSAQVTVRVPHADGEDRFVVRNPQPMVQGTFWVPLSRVDAPKENRSADYISFEVSYTLGDRGVFKWAGGQEIDVFSFENSGPCLGPTSLMTNHDAFMPPNSAGTNPGNYIAIRGLNDVNDNDYVGILGSGIAECGVRTDVRLGNYAVHDLPTGVLITWQTVIESDVAGFYLKQEVNGTELTHLNTDLIAAQHAGQGTGATYSQLVSPSQADTEPVRYWLQIVKLNGEPIDILLGPALRPRLHLPLLFRSGAIQIFLVPAALALTSYS